MKKAKYLTGVLGVIAAGVFLAGCSQSPMDIVKNDVAQNQIGGAYWDKIRKKDPETFKKVVAYCQSHVDKTNCTSVMETYVIDNGSTDVPAYGTSGDPVHLPKFKESVR